MKGFVPWIAGQADGDRAKRGQVGAPAVRLRVDNQVLSDPAASANWWQKLLAHNSPARSSPDDTWRQDERVDRNPDLWLYRDRTVGLLRRYMRFSLETGRLPSLVGREFFRAKVTSYLAVTFEDRVIFVRDVESCLNRLEYWDQQLIARVILQEHSQEKAARILHCSRKTIQRRIPEVLDLLSEDFLRVRLLVALPSKDKEQ